jgi:hypothetical protein
MWRRVKSVRPYVVHGHPSTLYQLALQVNGRCEAGRVFELFESSGETFEPYQREMITRVFGCRAVDCYGLAEVGVVAYQADDAPGMLVVDPAVWPEVDLCREEPCSIEEEKIGELVVTATRNRLMPLIRYRTGDLAVLNESPKGFVRDLTASYWSTFTAGSAASRQASGVPSSFIHSRALSLSARICLAPLQLTRSSGRSASIGRSRSMPGLFSVTLSISRPHTLSAGS